MSHIDRYLKLLLPPGQSAFLWGPRKTGKTTLIRQLYPESTVYDLLKGDLFFELTTRPWILRERITADMATHGRVPVVIDEVQKVPALLDEVHWLIENAGIQFILCGSSARKLKRGHANMLGGRAWRYQMFPLVYPELRDPDLIKILNNGLLPAHYLMDNAQKSLTAYVQDYLKEEVFDEGLTRNVQAFSRFFEAIGYSHGELVNYSNIARDCGVSSHTVKEYYQILVDTLLGYFILPYKRRQQRNIITQAPKFYLFDVGVANTIAKRRLTALRGEHFGKSLEHYILMELVAYSHYSEKAFDIGFWRKKSGIEVDFILGDGIVAIEVKGVPQVDVRDCRGLLAFREENTPQKCLVVSMDSAPRISGGVDILPWGVFLERLWTGKIV